MNDILREINYQLKNGSVLIKLILVNVLIFVIINLLWLLSFLSGNGNYLASIVLDWLVLPSELSQLLHKPWTFITYMFLHEDLMHALFNCVFLYFGGRLFQDFLGEKRLLPVYLLGGLSGAFLFVLAFNLFPVFSSVVSYSVALGASASALAILVAVATYLPEMVVHLLLFGPVRLKWIAAVAVVIDLISITRGNPGGHIAHLGGALFGFIYARWLKKGFDASLFFQTVLAKVSSVFSRNNNLKVSHKGRGEASKFKNKSKQEVIDQILDKISRSGYNSLTKEEKEILFKFSKED